MSSPGKASPTDTSALPDGSDRLEVSFVQRIADIQAQDWDACAGNGNPFVTFAFLDALEQSGSATVETGWNPRHLVVRDPTGKVVGVAPLYLKSHSYGEYVFDWGWAEAWHRAGGRYYPKLQCAVPFTPVTGPRLMVRAGADGATLSAAMAAGLKQLAKETKVSSLHVTFPTESQAQALGEAGFLLRMGYQYHWRNNGYASFEDFLADLASRKRKQVRRERQQVAESGVVVRTLVGDDVKARHWDDFHRFYCMVVDRKWGGAYLTREFFEHLSASSLGRDVVLIIAEENGRAIASAFNMLGGDTLYGRTWGAAKEIPFLHFEACYYRAIDFAIAHGLATVEAGAQGSHKISRGYVPVPTWSAHWIGHPAFRDAVARFLDQERLAVEAEMIELAEALPFRQGSSAAGGP